jgi:hypothetical protein
MAARNIINKLVCKADYFAIFLSARSAGLVKAVADSVDAAAFRMLNRSRMWLIYLINRKIILIKSGTDYEVYIFRRTSELINHKGIGCIYCYKDDDYFKFRKKASVIFEWGNLSKKHAPERAKVFCNIDMPKNGQYALLKKLGIRNFPDYKYTKSLQEIGKLRFPILAKPINGTRCEKIRLLMNKKELKIFAKSISLKDYLFSEYVKYGDYEYKWRLAFVDDLLLWSYLRMRPQKGYQEPKYSDIKKEDIESAYPPKEMLETARKISAYIRKIYPASFVGFDILCDEDFSDFKILEFNTSYTACYVPEWFDNEQRTTEKFANFLIEKFRD